MSVLLTMSVGVYAFSVAGVFEDPAPSVSFRFEYNENSGRLTIIHASGDEVPVDDLEVKASTSFEYVTSDGSLDGSADTSKTFREMGASDVVDAGDSVTIEASSGDLDAATVSVIYRPAGENSAVLDEWRGPDA